MANESMTLKNINVLVSEEQLKEIPEENYGKDELYMIPLEINIFDSEGKLAFPNGSLMWIA